jgi:type IV pilus assembly protein PilA
VDATLPPMSRRLSSGFAAREVLVVLALVAGILAIVAYAGFQKVRQSSEDKAVLCVVRQLAAAADQYYLENGVSTVELRQLVGATNYVKAVNTVAGECYPLRYTRGMTMTVTGIAGTRTVTYAP